MRGSTATRGYGTDHQRERERWRPKVDAGTVSLAKRYCRGLAPTATASANGPFVELQRDDPIRDNDVCLCSGWE